MKTKQWKSLLLKVKTGLEGLWVPVVNSVGRDRGTIRVVKDEDLNRTTITFLPINNAFEGQRLAVSGSIDKQAKKASAFFEEFIRTTDVPEYTIISAI